MTSPKRFLVLFLACMFLVMLAASLWQRFAHPDLTITRAPLASPEENNAVERIGQLMELAARNPENRDVLLHLVESLLAVGQPASAENFAQKALALDKPGEEDPRALYLLAVANHNQGRHAQAAELLEKMLHKSENPSARYSLGILYIHYLHEPALGVEQLERGLQAPDASAALVKAMRDELARARATLPPPGSERESPVSDKD